MGEMAASGPSPPCAHAHPRSLAGLRLPSLSLSLSVLRFRSVSGCLCADSWSAKKGQRNNAPLFKSHHSITHVDDFVGLALDVLRWHRFRRQGSDIHGLGSAPLLVVLCNESCCQLCVYKTTRSKDERKQYRYTDTSTGEEVH